MSAAEKQLQAFQAAVKTMRKTGLYGYNTAVTVQWPTPDDMMLMVKNIPRKIKDLKRKSNGGSVFGAFQVILSNGMASPVFAASGIND